MKILNLAYPEKSDIKYKISKFPDGQQQVSIIDNGYMSPRWTITSSSGHTKTGLLIINPVTIKSRLNNFQDLELIICATKSLRNLGVKEIHLYTPYFLGSRSDRQFEEGSNNYLRDIICPIINSLGFESVTVLDAHSYVLEACLNGFKSISNIDLVRFAIRDIYKPLTENSTNEGEEYIYVSPDAGASHKIYKLAEQIGYKGDIITCSKERDSEGKLTRTTIPFKSGQFCDKDIIIVDDICDGGATFINISKELRKDLHGSFNGKLYLIVTHGIFSKGFGELSQYFNGIYCTNSYRDLTISEEGEWSDFLLHNEKHLDLVKVLNIF